jgi:hypothetical protein
MVHPGRRRYTTISLRIQPGLESYGKVFRHYAGRQCPAQLNDLSFCVHIQYMNTGYTCTGFPASEKSKGTTGELFDAQFDHRDPRSCPQAAQQHEARFTIGVNSCKSVSLRPRLLLFRTVLARAAYRLRLTASSASCPQPGWPFLLQQAAHLQVQQQAAHQSRDLDHH